MLFPVFMDIDQPVFQRPEQVKYNVLRVIKKVLVRGKLEENVMNGIFYRLLVKA
jgi:hypothetical protein